MPVSPEPAGRRSIGRQGEDLALAYLREQGYGITACNWRTRAGELDIIATEAGCLVFVEVRARVCRGSAGPTLGPPEDSVTPRKQRQLVKMARGYLYEIDWRGPWRLDVIAVELRPDGALNSLRHYRDAIGE
jgi:putative endonuclease